MAKTRLRLVEIIGKYNGAPYKLGGSSREEGYDCFSLALALAEDFGVSIPKVFKGQTMETYSELWLKDRDKAKQVMFGLFAELGKSIPISRVFVGDVMIIEDKVGENVGTHAGKDLLLSAFTDIGVQLVSIGDFRIKGVYRWVMQDKGMQRQRYFSSH